MPFPHQQHAAQIGDRLNVLAAQLKTRTRASLNDANHWLESVMKRFFNALMGWDLVNLNLEKPNYPAADLGDKPRRIAIQVTNQNDSSKITETAATAARHTLSDDFDKLILFFLLPQKPGMPGKFSTPAKCPAIECWDVADLLKQLPELQDQGRLKIANDVLAKELGIRDTDESVYPDNLPGIYAGCVFVGRDAFLDDLRASLLSKTHATAIMQAPAATGISGLGGIGKTHAAVEYARRHQADYTATLFVSGDSPERLDSAFSALFDVLSLGRKDEVESDQAARVAAVMKWFGSHDKWLLIVDNVDDEAAAAALTGYFGHFGGGHVLITSRLQSWADNVATLPIEVLSLDESIDLLLQLTDKKRRRTDDEAAQACLLAEKLDGLPLALHQAAGYINEQRLTFAQYLAEYEQEAVRLLDWFKSHVIHYERLEKDTPKPVLITWKTSFDKLDADTRFWLLVFAHFAPDPIPEFLLDSAPEASNKVKTLLRSAQDALAQAESYSLLTRYDGPPRFKLHRLVQHILRLTTPEAERATALAMGIQLFVENDPGDPQDVRTWNQWTPLQPHAVSLVTHAPHAPAQQHLSWLLSCLVLLLNNKSLQPQAALPHNHPLGWNASGYGPDHSNIRCALNNPTGLLQDTNRLAATEPLFRRALGIDAATYGIDHPNVAIRLNDLAQLLRAINRLAEAELLMWRALKIFETSYGPDHPKVAILLDNLAQCFQKTNRLEEAEMLLRRALKIFEGTYGPDSLKVGIRLAKLAELFIRTNQLDEAEMLMRRVLGIHEAHYGLHHIEVARDLNNLAKLLEIGDRLVEAGSLWHRAIGIFALRLGISDSETQDAGRHYMDILQALGMSKDEVKERLRSAVEGG